MGSGQTLLTDINVQPWPIVERFLIDMPIGSIGLDLGCGNGKYLAVNPNVFIVGSDRSVWVQFRDSLVINSHYFQIT